MNGQLEGILRSFNPEKRYGWLNRRTESGIEVYYFVEESVIKNKAIVGLKATFFVDPVRLPGKHPRAVEIEFEEWTDPTLKAGQNTLGGEVSR